MLKNNTLICKFIGIILISSFTFFSCTSLKTGFITKPYTEYETIYKRVQSDTPSYEMVDPAFLTDDAAKTIFIGDFVQSQAIPDQNVAITIKENLKKALWGSSYWTLKGPGEEADYVLQLYVRDKVNDIFYISAKISYPQNNTPPWMKEISCPADTCSEEILKLLLPQENKSVQIKEKMVEEKIPVVKYSLEKNQTEYFDGMKALGVITRVALVAGLIYLIVVLAEEGGGWAWWPWLWL